MRVMNGAWCASYTNGVTYWAALIGSNSELRKGERCEQTKQASDL